MIYKHDSLVGKLRPDLMSNTVDSIWLELGFQNHKKILVGGLYRVWQHMGQGANKESLTPVAQLDRWKLFVSQCTMRKKRYLIFNFQGEPLTEKCIF